MPSKFVNRALLGNTNRIQCRQPAPTVLLVNIKIPMQEKRLVNFVLLGGIKKLIATTLPVNSAILGSIMIKQVKSRKVLVQSVQTASIQINMARLLVSYVQQGCTKINNKKQAARLVLMDNFKMRMERDPANNACLVTMKMKRGKVPVMPARKASIMMKQVKSRKVFVKSAQLDVKRQVTVLLHATTVLVGSTKMKPNKVHVNFAKTGNTNNLWSKHSVIRANLADGKIKLAKRPAKLV